MYNKEIYLIPFYIYVSQLLMHLFRGCETMIEIQLLIHTPWSTLPTPKTDGFLSNYHDTLCVRYNRLEETPCLHRGLLWILREGHPFRPWCPHFHPNGTMRLISTQSQTAPSFLVHLQTKTPQFWSFQNSGTMRSSQQKKGIYHCCIFREFCQTSPRGKL